MQSPSHSLSGHMWPDPCGHIFCSSPTSHQATTTLAFFLILKHANLIPIYLDPLHCWSVGLKYVEKHHINIRTRDSALRERPTSKKKPAGHQNHLGAVKRMQVPGLQLNLLNELWMGPRITLLSLGNAEGKPHQAFEMGAKWDPAKTAAM